MANFSGLHMDSWGEMEMVGTIMDRDVEMVPCETLDLTVPAEAEIVVEGRVKLNTKFRVGDVTSPSMYHLPHYEELPEVEIAMATSAGRPSASIWRAKMRSKPRSWSMRSSRCRSAS